ncbi:hypothetical protein RMT79_000217 [Enterobacter kobei]|nr:hypothetical protein [Enterobacter kobei]
MYCPECLSGDLSKEVIAGSKTGDYVCGNCHAILSKEEILRELPSDKEEKK